MTDRMPLEQCAGMTSRELDAQIRVRRELWDATSGGWLAHSMTLGEIPAILELKASRSGRTTPEPAAEFYYDPSEGDAMDRNKLETLRRIGYQVKRTCGLCRHSRINGGGPWGTCDKPENEYVHAKHTGEPRKLSINASGWCPAFEPLSEAETARRLHGFAQLVEEES